MGKYTNCITINQALYFDLFDDIPYKWLKLVLDLSIDRDEYDFEVNIEDLPCDRPAHCIVKFTFVLRKEDDVLFGETRYTTKGFTKTIEYNGSSYLALTLCGMVGEDSENENENTDTDTEDIYTSNNEEEEVEEKPEEQEFKLRTDRICDYDKCKKEFKLSDGQSYLHFDDDGGALYCCNECYFNAFFKEEEVPAKIAKTFVDNIITKVLCDEAQR